MNIWSEMMTALRGGMDEWGDAMAVQQAIDILDEQIAQVERSLQQHKESLATALVAQKNATHQVQLLTTEIAKYEGYALKALEQNDEPLAMEVAEQIAILETELIQQKDIQTVNSSECEQCRHSIRQIEQNLQRLKYQRDTIKASSNVQQAQQSMSPMSVSADGKTHHIQTARAVLERLKQRQAAQKVSAGEKSTNDLQSRLKKAGIIEMDDEVDADKVLNRIKN